MMRFFILLGYFALTLYLQLSGKLSHYINLHYSYLVYISMLLSLLLALVQFYIWIKKINWGCLSDSKFGLENRVC